MSEGTHTYLQQSRNGPRGSPYKRCSKWIHIQNLISFTYPLYRPRPGSQTSIYDGSKPWNLHILHSSWFKFTQCIQLVLVCTMVWSMLISLRLWTPLVFRMQISDTWCQPNYVIIFAMSVRHWQDNVMSYQSYSSRIIICTHRFIYLMALKHVWTIINQWQSSVPNLPVRAVVWRPPCRGGRMRATHIEFSQRFVLDPDYIV